MTGDRQRRRWPTSSRIRPRAGPPADGTTDHGRPPVRGSGLQVACAQRRARRLARRLRAGRRHARPARVRPSSTAPPSRSPSASGGLGAARVRIRRARCGSWPARRAPVRDLPRVSDQFQRLLSAHNGVVVATVTSAASRDGPPRSAPGSRRWPVDLRTAIDPALPGGLTVDRRPALDASSAVASSGSATSSTPGHDPASYTPERNAMAIRSDEIIASSRARSSRSTRPPRPAASGRWSRSAGIAQVYGSTGRSRRGCSSFPAGGGPGPQPRGGDGRRGHPRRPVRSGRRHRRTTGRVVGARSARRSWAGSWTARRRARRQGRDPSPIPPAGHSHRPRRHHPPSVDTVRPASRRSTP